LRRARRAQRGVVLALSLILLVIISLVSVMAVRGSLSSEQVAKNLRTNAIAMQAAEMALRFCENQVMSGASIYPINEMPLTSTATFPTLWQTRANWSDSAIAGTLSDEVTNSANTAARALATRPQCMIERYPLLTATGGVPRESYLITAVGYSPDYRTSSGQITSGGEVWLQSILRY
jgi:type IV pilus assembly protein PilX